MKLVKKEKTEQKKNKKKVSRLTVALTVIALSGAAVITGSGVYITSQAQKISDRKSFGDNVVAKLNGESVSVAEFMLYSLDIKNGYEQQQGKDVWTQEKTDANGNKDTFENVTKEDVLEQIRFIWALKKEGNKKGIKLTEDENKVLKETADDYYTSLQKAKIDESLISPDDVLKFYKEYYYGQKVYYQLTGDNSVNESTASTGSSISTDSENTNASTTKDGEKLWQELVDRWYPDFDYNLDINWDLLDQISFAESNKTDTDTESTDTDNADSGSDDQSDDDTENDTTESEDK